jgi:hypothetical protein
MRYCIIKADAYNSNSYGRYAYKYSRQHSIAASMQYICKCLRSDEAADRLSPKKMYCIPYYL